MKYVTAIFVKKFPVDNGRDFFNNSSDRFEALNWNRADRLGLSRRIDNFAFRPEVPAVPSPILMELF
jgi:hypothetical protein